MTKEMFLLYVGSFKAAEMWMHSAHHLTKGPSFIANHELLYGRIYETLSEDFDKLVEKMVYQFDDEDFACPILISSIASQILKNYDSPSNLDEKNIAMLSFVLIVDHMKGAEKLREDLESAGMLTLGFDDFLSSAVNQYETYAYSLNQYTKGIS
tara:strand:+ start:428 stop:889 length:462 start_codon:yes stop_codon:yes gene_type:complete